MDDISSSKVKTKKRPWWEGRKFKGYGKTFGKSAPLIIPAGKGLMHIWSVNRGRRERVRPSYEKAGRESFVKRSLVASPVYSLEWKILVGQMNNIQTVGGADKGPISIGAGGRGKETWGRVGVVMPKRI